MPTQTVTVATFHPDSRRADSADVAEILEAMPEHASEWTWRVRHLETTHHETFVERVERAGRDGLCLSYAELLRHARQFGQTIEGTFIATPHGEPLDDLRDFPDSPAEIVIVAVDGGCFDIYAKDAAMLDGLRPLGSIQDGDPARFFPGDSEVNDE